MIAASRLGGASRDATWEDPRPMRTAATLLTSLALLAVPAAAPAQQSPFAPLPQAAQSGTPTVVVSPSNSDTGGLKGWQQGLIVGAGMILLVGIGWAIVSDASSKAPVKDSELAHPGRGGAERQNRTKKQRERARAKAKVGRAQRKHNRKR
jgi:hypothetical protein